MSTAQCSALTVVAVEVVVLARHCALTEVLVNLESHALQGMVMRWRGIRGECEGSDWR
jgi:hypothetical protein